MNRKQKRIMQSNYFLRTGVKLFRKATGRSLDISTLVKSNFDKESLSRHNKRIKSDPEFRDPDAIISEVTSMLLSIPGDSFYPEISLRNKKWLAMLGIKPNKSRFGLLLYYRYLTTVILSLIRDVIESVRLARQRGTFKGTPIHDMVNYLFSRSIANRHEYDKGRQKPVSNDVYYRLRARTRKPEDMPDTEAGAFVDQIESKLLYQQLTSIIQQFDTADKLAIRTQVLANQAHIPFEAAFYQNQDGFYKLGIHSPRAAKKRLRYLPNKYRDLQVIRESRKR